MSLPALTDEDTKTKCVKPKKFELIEEAISWPKGGDQNSRLYTTIYEHDEFTVRLAKPGKEAAPDYNRCTYKDKTTGNNPNDMRPELTRNGELIEMNATFGDIFDEFIQIHAQSPESIDLLAYLLGRNAYLADHRKTTRGWRYFPQAEALEELRGLISEAYGVPIDVFIHYLEALALNEDVKYHTLGYEVHKETGRRNNLLTCVHLLAVLAGRESISKFAGGFARPPSGISAISKTKMYEYFELLRPI